jgi:hypothetical protein
MVIAYAMASNGRCPARDFLESREPSDKDKRKLIRHFDVMATYGEIKNDENFKKLEGRREVHEFKGHKARVFAFRMSNVWFLTSGVVKKRDEHRPSDIDSAERIWEEHKAWMRKEGIA